MRWKYASSSSPVLPRTVAPGDGSSVRGAVAGRRRSGATLSSAGRVLRRGASGGGRGGRGGNYPARRTVSWWAILSPAEVDDSCTCAGAGCHTGGSRPRGSNGANLGRGSERQRANLEPPRGGHGSSGGEQPGRAPPAGGGPGQHDNRSLGLVDGSRARHWFKNHTIDLILQLT